MPRQRARVNAVAVASHVDEAQHLLEVAMAKQTSVTLPGQLLKPGRRVPKPPCVTRTSATASGKRIHNFTDGRAGANPTKPLVRPALELMVDWTVRYSNHKPAGERLERPAPGRPWPGFLPPRLSTVAARLPPAGHRKAR